MSARVIGVKLEVILSPDEEEEPAITKLWWWASFEIQSFDKVNFLVWLKKIEYYLLFNCLLFNYFELSIKS